MWEHTQVLNCSGYDPLIGRFMLYRYCKGYKLSCVHQGSYAPCIPYVRHQQIYRSEHVSRGLGRMSCIKLAFRLEAWKPVFQLNTPLSGGAGESAHVVLPKANKGNFRSKSSSSVFAIFPKEYLGDLRILHFMAPKIENSENKKLKTRYTK
ncbi:unnamed protein product [Nezara viridula]|uniref:Uncharacterized protein n=1 Tax=Nezara viridula TaxID=85310 RepID=A0A9P0MXB9_NEZVI|nr:unnamed protein product [Nezara viridula]